jgi:RNA recognition motif-containing protein
MAKNIYVGNLTWDASADDLLALFQEHGKVGRAQVITDRETGRSRGFGFVEMEDDTEAANAITALNGTPFRGRNLTVNEARPREDTRGGGGGGGGRGGYGGGGGGYGGGGGRSGGMGGGGGGGRPPRRGNY